jgi:transposase
LPAEGGLGARASWADEEVRCAALGRLRTHQALAHARDAARTYGKSDPIDALAAARAALREDDLPTAHLDGADRDLRLLVDHREDLIAERTRAINRLRWHLHELDPEWDPPARSLDRINNLDRILSRLADLPGVVAHLATAITERCRNLTEVINTVEAKIRDLAEKLVPALIALPGCGALTAAKILGETAGIARFHSAAAYARHNGTAPLPMWTSNRARHRLSRTDNRQLNAALHRIAMTQARCYQPAKGFITRRKAGGDGLLDQLAAGGLQGRTRSPPRPETTPVRGLPSLAGRLRRHRSTEELSSVPQPLEPLQPGSMWRRA